jgi:hypothetical protein
MELEKVGFEIEEVEKCLQEIEDIELRRYLSNYHANIEQILGSLAVPLLLMSHGLKSVRYFQYWLQGAIATKNVGKEKTEKAKAEIEEYIKSKFKEEKEIHIEDAKKEIGKLRKEIPFLENSLQNEALNTLVNTWTMFEATVKNIWVYCLNSYPRTFLSNILKSNPTDIDGIDGKKISISLLAKYNFNVTNELGNILQRKFDFTTVRGIKKSFQDLFNLKTNDLSLFENKNLVQLEIIRHLVVHNAGYIDNEYLSRTKRKGEKLGERVSLTDNELGDYCNASILTAVKLFRLADNKINNR